MLRFSWPTKVGFVSLFVFACANGCGGDESASGSRHEHGGSAGESGSGTGTAGRGGTGGASGTNGGAAASGRGGSGAGDGGTGNGGSTNAGSAGVPGDAGEGGASGGEGGQAGGEGGASAGDGGEAGAGAAGSGGVAGSGGIGGLAGAGMGGAGMGGAGMGGAGTGGAGGGGATIPGLDVPCQNGPGWTLLRWHYEASRTSPFVDVWDATCSYSASSSSTCTIETVGGVSMVESGTAVWIDGTDELRARFGVSGLVFTGADVHVRARSYSTNASTRIRVASVVHGETIIGPVSQEFTHRWYHADFTGNLLPADQPLSTAIRLFAQQGSTSLAISSVEVCLR